MLDHDLTLQSLSSQAWGSFRIIQGALQNPILPGLFLSAWSPPALSRACTTVAGLEPQMVGWFVMADTQRSTFLFVTSEAQGQLSIHLQRDPTAPGQC